MAQLLSGRPSAVDTGGEVRWDGRWLDVVVSFNEPKFRQLAPKLVETVDVYGGRTVFWKGPRHGRIQAEGGSQAVEGGRSADFITIIHFEVYLLEWGIIIAKWGIRPPHSRASEESSWKDIAVDQSLKFPSACLSNAR